jgi:hypothetical protein
MPQHQQPQALQLPKASPHCGVYKWQQRRAALLLLLLILQARLLLLQGRRLLLLLGLGNRCWQARMTACLCRCLGWLLLPPLPLAWLAWHSSRGSRRRSSQRWLLKLLLLLFAGIATAAAGCCAVSCHVAECCEGA